MPTGVYKRIKKTGGWKLSQDDKDKISIRMMGHRSWSKGIERPRWVREKISDSHKGMKKPWASLKGELNHVWVKDRTKLQKYGEANQDRRSSTYRDWRKQVWIRDNWKCKIQNKDCKGRLEAHHILGYTEHPELRYDINNGITLCHFHHPFKKDDEKKLSPYFQSLVAEMK